MASTRTNLLVLSTWLAAWLGLGAAAWAQPTGLGISVNGGRAFTISKRLDLALSATGATEMRFYATGAAAWTPWMPYQPSYSLDLEELSDGPKTVQFEARDAVGSAAAQSVITLVNPRVLINNDVPQAVHLDAVVSLAAKGAASMWINDGTGWVKGDYRSTYTVTMPPNGNSGTPERRFTIWAQFTDALGHDSEVVSDSIEIVDDPLPDPADAFTLHNATLFEPVLPADAPGPALTELRLDGSPGEVTYGCFVVHAAADLRDVSVALDADLAREAGGASIPAAQVDLRAVGVWLQDRDFEEFGDYQPLLRPELLLKDDRTPLVGWVEDDPVNHTGHVELPIVAGGDAVITHVPYNTCKEILLIAHIPGGQPEGVYAANVEITCGAAHQSLPLRLTVHPIALPDLGADLNKAAGIYFAGFLLPGKQATLTAAEMAMQFTDIRDHGFNAAYLAYSDLDNWATCAHPDYDTTLGIIQSVWGDPRLLVANVHYRIMGLEPSPPPPPPPPPYPDCFTPSLYGRAEGLFSNVYYYGMDEPYAGELQLHLDKCGVIHGAGGRSATSTTFDVAPALDLDLPIYSLGPDATDAEALHDYVTGRQQGTEPKAFPEELMYWQAWREDPRESRFNLGFFLAQSPLDGALPYVYQMWRGNPYNDWDPAADPGDLATRDMLITYPARDALADLVSVPTVQWEACRRAVNDARYVEALREKIAQVVATGTPQQVADALEIETTLDTVLLPPFKSLLTLGGGGSLIHAWTTVTPHDFEDTRGAVADMILRLSDRAPTDLSVAVAEGGCVSARSITLHLSAWGAARMCFSVDSGTWTSWEPFAATKPLVLPDADGSHTIDVKAKDVLDNECAPVGATVTLDRGLLSSGYVMPTSGDMGERSTYRIKYWNCANTPPTRVWVAIWSSATGTASWRQMWEYEPWDTDCVDGKWYTYTSQLSGGDYACRFAAELDGHWTYWPQPPGTYRSGPQISPVLLSSGYVTPTSGTHTTDFTWRVKYWNSQNQPPDEVWCAIWWGSRAQAFWYRMYPLDPSDTDCSDGKWYTVHMKWLDSTAHSFRFAARQGAHWAYWPKPAGTYASGPTVGGP